MLNDPKLHPVGNPYQYFACLLNELGKESRMHANTDCFVAFFDSLWKTAVQHF